MTSLTSLMGASLPSETDSAQEKAYVTYAFPCQQVHESGSLERSVTLLESRSVISSLGTTGLRTWEAALHLGAFLSSDLGRGMVRGKNVFELGAGTGMLSILCAKHLQVSGIVATDGDEAVVDAIKTNSFLNSLDAPDPPRTTVDTAALRWGWPMAAATFSEDYGMDLPDVVVGADVVSSPQAPQESAH
jgi:predicted nicotinamide N-methyase